MAAVRIVLSFFSRVVLGWFRLACPPIRSSPVGSALARLRVIDFNQSLALQAGAIDALSRPPYSGPPIG